MLFTSISQSQGLPPGLLSALCWVESRHHTEALNLHDGGSSSCGICQIKLDTAQTLGFGGTAKGLTKPQNNILYAGRYLKYQIKRYKGDLRKGVAAYNSGTHRVNKKGQTCNRRYVELVFKAWAEGR